MPIILPRRRFLFLSAGIVASTSLMRCHPILREFSSMGLLYYDRAGVCTPCTGILASSGEIAMPSRQEFRAFMQVHMPKYLLGRLHDL